jgi:hypothetical protein
MTTNNDTDRLAALIAAKLQVLEILARLSRRQLAMIDAGEMTPLIKLLASKQTVMSQLQALEEKLQPFRGDDPEARVWHSASDRWACQAQADRCNALLVEALTLEKQAEEAMLRRRDAAVVALSAAQSATDARTAYAVTPLKPTAALQVEG